MKKVHTHRLITAAALAAALAAAGCGGGGGSTPPATTTLEGAIVDGYLSNARVCLDKNRNAKCDAGETSDISKTNGSYKLTVDSGDAAKYPVVAVVDTDAIDADTGAVAKAYVLMAPAGAQAADGKVNVTPMTTLVQSAMLQAPSLTPAEAEAQVKSDMGAPPQISLFEDYVARKANNNHYRDIHQVAQVVARVLGENKAAIRTAADAAGLTPTDQEIASAVSKAAADQMEQIMTIASAPANFTNGVIKTGTDITAAKTTYNEADVKAAIANAQSTAAATKSNIVAVFQAATHYVDIYTRGQDTYEFNRGTTQQNTAGTQIIFSDEKYVAGSSTWNADVGSNLLLVNGSWQSYTDNVMDFATQADGSAAFSSPAESGNVRISEMDISGRAVADFYRSTLGAIKANATFSAGAKAYIMTIVQNADRYKINQWTNCGGSPTINGNCNAVVRFDQSGQQVTNYLTTLVELLQVTDRGLIEIGGGGDRLTVLFSGGGTGAAGESGTATFYTAPQGQNLDSTTPAAGTGTWKIVNVGGQLLLEVENVPLALVSKMDVDRGRTLFFAVQNGAVRRGEFQAKGVPSTSNGSPNLNGVAYQDVLNALELSKSYTATANPAPATATPAP